MDFIGSSTGATNGRVPAPNVSLSPEMLCKNYPFEFLVQPIVPLLSPPTSEKPSFCLSIPALKEACLVVSGFFSKPTIQFIGIGIVATFVSYGVWKVSLKMSEGIFAKEPEDEVTTEKLDDEVARILSTIAEECTISTSCSCSNVNSQRDGLQRFSTTSSMMTDRLSQDSRCSCNTDVGKPLKQLQSRIDQVMSRVEVVISSLRVLEDNIASPKKDGQQRAGGDEERPKPKHIQEVQVVSLMKKDNNRDNGVFELSLPENRSDKVPVPSNQLSKLQGLYSVPKQKYQMEPCIGTQEPAEDLANIHRRIKDLEKRVENFKNNGQDKKISPCGSMQSSFCSDRWEKSSSVSVISEHEHAMGGGLGSGGVTSPRTLPITVHNLMSPCSEPLTPPSADHHGKLYGFNKNMKRNNTRSRPVPCFTQFPTIEEDPLSFTENDIDHKTMEEKVKNQKQHSSSCAPDGEFTLTRHWDRIGDAECQQAYRFEGVKRQGTWPRLHRQYRDVEPSLHIPKINTLNSQFKRSVNSCFEATKPSTMNTERMYCHTTGINETSLPVTMKVQNSPRREHSRKDVAQKNQNSPRREHIRKRISQNAQISPRKEYFSKENFQMRSNDFCFDRTSCETFGSVPHQSQNYLGHTMFPTENSHLVGFGINPISSTEYTPGAINSMTKTVQGSQIVDQKREEGSEPDLKKTSPKPTTTAGKTLSDSDAEVTAELKAPKHKLVTSEMDAPPRKVIREDIVVSKSSQCTNTTSISTSSEDTPETVVEDPRRKGATTPTHCLSADRFRRLSPFKRSSRKNSNFQVKYVSSKKGTEDSSDQASSTGQIEKEDEWIVIVPNEKSQQ